MCAEDLPLVVGNERRAYAFPWTEGIFTDCINAGYECWVCEMRNEAIGHAVMSIGAGEAHLLNVCIRRDQQGSGYGVQLINHMLEQARMSDAEHLFLEVRPSNYAANQLYEQLGFREIGVRKEYYPSHLGHEDARVLALDLSIMRGSFKR